MTSRTKAIKAKKAEQRRKRRAQHNQGSSRSSGAPGPRPDANASPEIRAAMVQAERLLRLGDAGFPRPVSSKVLPEPRSLDNWDLVAPAMLFSASSCLLSIRLLAGTSAPRREQDASVLLRRLYEHVVDFAWIAIDPVPHTKMWVADDYKHRLKVADEIQKLGYGAMQPATRTSFEDYIRVNGTMPDCASRADAADKFWSGRIQGHGVFPKAAPALAGPAASGNWSLRTFYTVIYRPASANAHPTPMSIQAYVTQKGPPGEFIIGMNVAASEDRFSYTYAPLIYSVMLLVAEQVLGGPARGDIEAVFQGPALPSFYSAPGPPAS